MKNLTISIVAVLFLGLSSCSVSPPMKVAKKYLKALQSNNIEKAKEYVSPGSVETFNSIFGPDTEITSKYEVLREEVNGNEATIYYKEKGNEQERSLSLRNIEGEWKVILFSSSGK